MASVATISVNFAQYNTSDFSPTQTSVKSVNPLTLAQYCQGTSTPEDYQGGFLKKTSISISNSQPSNPTDTNLWYNSSSGVFSIYDNSQWKNVTSINPINTPTVTLTYNPTNGDLSANAEYLLSLINTLSSNMQNIGNYPYMEFGWQTAPNAAAQTITANGTWQNLNLTSIMNQNGTSFGTLGTNNINLNAGTYRFQVAINAHAPYNSINGTGFLAIKTTDETYLASRGHAGNNATYQVWSDPFDGQFTISSSKTVELAIACQGAAVSIMTFDVGGQSSITTANAEKRVSFKLWKVG